MGYLHLLPALVEYYNWLCSEVTSGSSAPVSPKLKNVSATRVCEPEFSIQKNNAN